MAKLPLHFYRSENVLDIANALLGKILCTFINGELCKGKIVETEAYNGIIDKASHAFGGRYTDRTRIMYAEGGVAYVYLCYGIHNLFNVITGKVGEPHAVLIRGIAPISGLDTMLQRRNMTKMQPRLTAGPGALSKALGISRLNNGISLVEDTIWIEDAPAVPSEQVITGSRIGVDYAGTDALLPYRFYIKGNAFVSLGSGLKGAKV